MIDIANAHAEQAAAAFAGAPLDIPRPKPKRPRRPAGTVGAWRLAAARVPDESHRQLRVIRKSGESMTSLFMRWIQAEYDALPRETSGAKLAEAGRKAAE